MNSSFKEHHDRWSHHRLHHTISHAADVFFCFFAFFFFSWLILRTSAVISAVVTPPCRQFLWVGMCSMELLWRSQTVQYGAIDSPSGQSGLMMRMVGSSSWVNAAYISLLRSP